MFRLFIVLSFIVISSCSLSQNSKRELIYKASLNAQQEDFVEATILYDSILKIDSSNCEILNEYSEILFQSKNFIQAENYLKKLQYLDKKQNYEPNTFLKLGLVSQQLGKYEEAIEHFNQVISISNNKEEFTSMFNKATREIESCTWANENKKDTLPYTIHKIHGIASNDSEFGHAVSGPYLIISSLHCNNCIDSVGFAAENYTNKLFTVKKENGGQIKEITSLNSNSRHTSNGTFSSNHKKFYFSSCSTDPQNKNCKILVSNYNKGKWSKPDTLIGEINNQQASYTMPSYGTINETDYLFFCSDMKNGQGGLDIYVGTINDNFIENVKPIKNINSIEDDIAPYFDNVNSTLYFSSTWRNGFGGFDLFKTKFNLSEDNEIINLGIPFNSSNNDTYIIKDSNTFFVTSNRNHGVINKTCCADIYRLIPIPKLKKDSISTLSHTDSMKLVTIKNRENERQKNIQQLEKLIPVSLYFHNDIPNPRSKDTNTQINYIETYEKYIKLKPLYEINYSKGVSGEKKKDAIQEIQSFYSDYVEEGKKELDEFLSILETELKNGSSFELIFKGFASPLAQTDYNKFLSKRRISSVKNYLAFYNNGILLNYLIPLNGEKAKLVFKEEPFGEFNANKLVSDNPNDRRNSVYSKKAALERKVEIIGFRVL